MKKITSQPSDHRWFIWTIVFLLVSGVSLVSYILISEINYETELYDVVQLNYPVGKIKK